MPQTWKASITAARITLKYRLSKNISEIQYSSFIFLYKASLDRTEIIDRGVDAILLLQLV